MFKEFLPPAVALHFHKSTIQSCMEYCCHVWTGVPSYYLELVGKVQIRLYRIVDRSVATSLEPVAS